MKKEASAFSVLLETLMENNLTKKQENEEELGIILVFMRNLQLSVQELQLFNEATQKEPLLLGNLKKAIRQE